MTRQFYLLIFILPVAFFCNSCSNKLDLTAPWQDIPIVYGMVSVSDTATYIRVEKAFIDPAKSAQEIARIPDSLYYTDLTVQLIKNGNAYNLTKVDASKEGYTLQDGVFASSPNYLYKISNKVLSLQADDNLTLKVVRSGAILTQSTINVVGAYETLDGFPDFNPPYVNISSTASLSIGFRSDEKTAKFYDVALILHYTETDPKDPNKTVSKQLQWDVQKRVSRKNINGQPTPQIIVQRDQSLDLFTFMASAIPVVTGISRQFQTFDIQVGAGGQELLNYINVGVANTGITGSQSPPTYTNLSNGYGLFTSRNILLKQGYQLNAASLDLLKSGNITKQLNFR